MIAYLDSSVVLRLLLGEAGRLREWDAVLEGVCSALVRVECLRAIDRLQLAGTFGPDEAAERRAEVYRFLEGAEVVALSDAVLDQASLPFAIPLGTFDAVHLATALSWAEVRRRPLVMATHDVALARAARAVGLDVIGA